MISYLDNFDPAVSECYLCGKKIKSIDNLYRENKEQIINLYHKNCFKFYNRLQIVYGKSLSEFGLEKVRWDTFSGNLFELMIMELKKTKMHEKGIQYNKNQFLKLMRYKINNANDEVLLVCSNSYISKYYIDILKFLLKNYNTEQKHIKDIRILVPKDHRLLELLNEYIMNQSSNLKISYIHENLENVFLVVIDKNHLFFSEFNYDNNNQITYPQFNIFTENDYIVWYVSAIFESLWKQSDLEGKISELYTEQNKRNLTRENFIRMFVHELKVPLQPIIGFSDLIQSNNRLTSEQKNELLKIISRNAKKLDLLANNILDYARMENNIFKLNIELVDIVKTIKELIDDYQMQADKKGLVIDFVNNLKNQGYHLDKLRITEVLDNLINNAIKFTQKGLVRISVIETNNNLNIKIMDTGTGIEDKDKEKLFSKFFTTDTIGTGLGLYLSKIIVEKHRGIIEVKNNSPQSGCTFSISIPVSNSNNMNQNL